MPPGGINPWLFGRKDSASSSPIDRVRSDARAARGERRAGSERRPGHPENPHWRGRLGRGCASPALPDDAAAGGQEIDATYPNGSVAPAQPPLSRSFLVASPRFRPSLPLSGDGVPQSVRVGGDRRRRDPEDAGRLLRPAGSGWMRPVGNDHDGAGPSPVTPPRPRTHPASRRRTGSSRCSRASLPRPLPAPAAPPASSPSTQE